jgi:hypothetical protein
MKTFLLAAVALAAILTPATGAPLSKYQACSGTLVEGDDGYMLKPDAGAGSWCDAIISSGEYIGGDNLVPKVLKVCAVGSRCRIKGTFEGHGVFYWNKILEVMPVK